MRSFLTLNAIEIIIPNLSNRLCDLQSRVYSKHIRIVCVCFFSFIDKLDHISDIIVEKLPTGYIGQKLYDMI